MAIFVLLPKGCIAATSELKGWIGLDLDKNKKEACGTLKATTFIATHIKNTFIARGLKNN